MRATKRLSDEATQAKAEQRACANPSSLRRSVAPSLVRRGFSFTEVMFAVVIMGIGFIMVAAIFPVAIQQARDTTDETIARTMSLRAGSVLETLSAKAFVFNPGTSNEAKGPILVATDLQLRISDSRPPVATAEYPADATTLAAGESKLVRGKVVMFGDPRVLNDVTSAAAYPLRYTMWHSVRSEQIVTADPRYAWIAMYRRDRTYRNTDDASHKLADEKVVKEDAPYAQVIVVVVAARNTPTFTAADVRDTLPANLQPRRIKICIAQTQPPRGEYFAWFYRNEADYGALAPGAYVIISDDQINQPDPGMRGMMNGRIYRIGARRTDVDGLRPGYIPNTMTDAWELVPGSEFRRDPGGNGRFYDQTTNNGDRDDIVAIGNTSAVPGSNSDTRAAAAADALVIGRGWADPTNPDGGYAGPSMAVTVYTTFVKVN